jgi:hypothetical protein
VPLFFYSGILGVSSFSLAQLFVRLRFDLI